ncbi:hypothetical protein BH23GEM9_BH23GEM9_05690 [soil metagenome]
MARETVQGAADRSERLLLSSPVLETLLARRDLGLDAGTASDLIMTVASELCSTREPDGCWQGSACRTAEYLLLLHELADGSDALDELARPSVEWLRRRITKASGAPVPAGEAVPICTPLLHEIGLCAHRSPCLIGVVPARVDLAGLRLLNGSGVISDVDGRVAVSALAVAALLSWGGAMRELGHHVGELARITLLEDRQRMRVLSTNGMACVALALLAAEAATSADGAGAGARPGASPAAGAGIAHARDAAPASAVDRGVAVLVRTQRGDGSWPTADLFFVLSVLVRAAAVRRHAIAVDPALRRSASQLALLQQRDGGWSRDGGTWSLLVGWRVLRAATATRPEPLTVR